MGLRKTFEEMNGAAEQEEIFDAELEAIRKEVGDLIELKKTGILYSTKLQRSGSPICSGSGFF
jgi:hypothetical protein